MPLIVLFVEFFQLVPRSSAFSSSSSTLRRLLSRSVCSGLFFCFFLHKAAIDSLERTLVEIESPPPPIVFRFHFSLFSPLIFCCCLNRISIRRKSFFALGKEMNRKTGKMALSPLLGNDTLSRSLFFTLSLSLAFFASSILHSTPSSCQPLAALH